jgi:hypothetical protein
MVALLLPEGEFAADESMVRGIKVLSDDDRAVLEEVYRERGCG